MHFLMVAAHRPWLPGHLSQKRLCRVRASEPSRLDSNDCYWHVAGAMRWLDLLAGVGGLGSSGFIGSLVTATIGAIVIIGLFRLFTGGRKAV